MRVQTTMAPLKSNVPESRTLVDDLPYVDQEYGDPGLRDTVKYISFQEENCSLTFKTLQHVDLLLFTIK